MPVIVDLGANIGAASLWFGRLFPRANVVAVEPHPDNVELLRRNIAHRPNNVVLAAAIGNEGGYVSLVDDGLGWAVKTERASSGLSVVTIQDVVDASGGDTLFMVKIDIEGFEDDLFASNLEWLERTFVVVIELHDWMLPGKSTSRNFQRAIAKHNFVMFIRGENIFYVRV